MIDDAHILVSSATIHAFRTSHHAVSGRVVFRVRAFSDVPRRINQTLELTGLEFVRKSFEIGSFLLFAEPFPYSLVWVIKFCANGLSRNLESPSCDRHL